MTATIPNFKYDTPGLWRKDRDHNIHPWTDFSTFKEQGSLVMAESEGCYVYDSEGERYLDGIGGLWCVNIGYGNEEMAQAIADQARRMTYYSSFGHITTPPAAQLATLRDLPIVGDVRGKCFMMCVENVADRETKALLPADAAVGNRIAAHAQKRGVIVRPIAHLNVLSPPLTMTKRQVDELVGVLRESIVETMGDLRREGLWSG